MSLRGCSPAPQRKARRALSDVRRTAVQTAVHVITTGILVAPLAGIAMKLRWFGPNPLS
jgi:hypothetical protein